MNLISLDLKQVKLEKFMKLRDFQKSSKNPKSSSKKLVINNVAAEERYKKEIEDLNSELEHSKNLKDFSNKIQRENSALVKESQRIRDNQQKSQSTIEELKTQIKFLEKNNSKIPNLENEILTTKGNLNIKSNELTRMTEEAMSKSKELSDIRLKYESSKTTIETLNKNIEESVSTKLKAESRFELVSNENKELKSFADETSKINKELKQRTEYLQRDTREKSEQVKTLLGKIEDLQLLSSKLKKELEEVLKTTLDNKQINNSLKGNITIQKTKVADMTEKIENMEKSLLYLTRMNKDYKDALAKPTYTSMAAIASQEGFVMPNGKENIRTHNLGNYKPTMLKFKKKEETQNGR